MPTFIVERDLPGITPEQLQAAGVRAKTCCEEMASEGTDVRWHRSFFLPESEKTFCVFEAVDREMVAEANRRAKIPFERIHDSVEMTPDAI
ncbi:MAG TPA: DUF4242 domain-containing protein [Gemmatimonadota bacterium]|nr:DUF4242 domain-containing protein [Gemmatimonadota bacterium]